MLRAGKLEVWKQWANFHQGLGVYNRLSSMRNGTCMQSTLESYILEHQYPTENITLSFWTMRLEADS
jgi:hypothetical protein